jgi:cell wall-associated NlpC family hydrolase
LVFFHSGGSVYHVAIYAGNNYIWHAPHTGAKVRKEKMWTQNVWYGRIR